MASNISVEEQIKDGNMYFVCLLDIMGQGEFLNNLGNAFEDYIMDFKLGANPNPDKMQEKKLELDSLSSEAIDISNTICIVKDFFNDLLKNLKDYNYTEKCIKAVLDETIYSKDKKYSVKRDAIVENINKILNGIGLKCQHFSDTFLIYFKLPNFHHEDFINTYIPVVGIIDIVLEKLSYSIIQLLAKKIVVRGAISVGMGWELGDGSFYGPVLNEVHNLETKVAKYPRIMTVKRVCVLLDLIYRKMIDFDSELGEYCEEVLNHLDKDTDGVYILNYLSKDLIKRCKREDSKASFDEIIKAYKFVYQSYLKFYSEGLECQKLTSYYRDLHHYFLSRLEYSVEWKSVLTPKKSDNINNII